MPIGGELPGLSPNGIIHLTSDRLEESEQDGTPAFIREGANVFLRVGSAFTPEDVRALGENIVHILMKMRNPTQPEVLDLADRASEALGGRTESKPVGAFGLPKAMRDPGVQRGTGVLLELLRSLGREAPPVGN